MTTKNLLKDDPSFTIQALLLILSSAIRTNLPIKVRKRTIPKAKQTGLTQLQDRHGAQSETKH